MMKIMIRVSLPAIACVLLVFPFFEIARGEQKPSSQPASQAQPSSAVSAELEEGVEPATVEVEGNPVLAVYSTVASFSPQERAAGIEKRIIQIASDSRISAEPVRLNARDGWTEIFVGNQIVMVVTDGDAKSAGETRDKLATEYAANIAHAIGNYRNEHSWREILKGAIYALLLTLVLVFVLWLIRRIRQAFRNRLERWIRAAQNVEERTAWSVSLGYFGPIVLAVGSIFRWIFILAIFETYLNITLGFFSFTREVSLGLTRWTLSQLNSLARTALDYLPNLVVIAVVLLIIYWLIRMMRVIFSEIAKGAVKIRGFYPDWAEPTEKLLRALVLAFTLIVIFPYLPGVKSPAFQGISIFLGVLLSLGSSSAVANAVAGVILTYMRSYLVGDWVEIGGTKGEVIEKTLLVTRVLTPKDEVITIPNSTVMSGAVTNYSVEARKSGVIFHTTVSIGYDAPWRVVHRLLISAALETEHIKSEPAPFVLQSALNDFYVSYELNAYTDCPREVLNIYSNLHRKIQDKFNEEGVEICSPHFASVRDGNKIAIPDQYIKPGYEAPGFRIDGNRTVTGTAVSLNETSDSRERL
jgi:small-conductance mechanosensitive channel